MECCGRLEDNLVAKIIRTRRTELIAEAAAGLALICLGSIMQYAASTETDKYLNISTLFFLGMTILINLLCAHMGVGNSFNMAITMGKTRKSYVYSSIVVAFLKYLLIFCSGYIIYKINCILPGKDSVCMDGIFRPDVLIVLIILLASVENILGVLFIKYGTKYAWILWILCMALNIFGMRAEEIMESEKDSVIKHIILCIIDFISGLSQGQLMGAGIAVAVIFTVVSSAMLLRQDITA